MTLFDIYLSKVKGLVAQATERKTEKWKQLNQITALVFLVKFDIPRLVRILEILKEQRDGYRQNYWAVTGIADTEQKEIAKDNDTEINKLIFEGLSVKSRGLQK